MHSLPDPHRAEHSSDDGGPRRPRAAVSYVPLLIIVALFGLVYVFFLRPRQQRIAPAADGPPVSCRVGDEGHVPQEGSSGRVVALDADEGSRSRWHPGVVMTFVRRAISPRARPGIISRAAGTGRDEGPALTSARPLRADR